MVWSRKTGKQGTVRDAIARRVFVSEMFHFWIPAGVIYGFITIRLRFIIRAAQYGHCSTCEMNGKIKIRRSRLKCGKRVHIAGVKWDGTRDSRHTQT